MLFQTLALTSASLFSGAAIYVSLIEQPARLCLDNKSLLQEWKPAYKKGAIMQSILALLASIFEIIAFVKGGSYLWLMGSIPILLNWPYSLIGIMPTNNQLLAIQINAADDLTRSLIIKWGKLDHIRTILGLISTLIFFLALSQ